MNSDLLLLLALLLLGAYLASGKPRARTRVPVRKTDYLDEIVLRTPAGTLSRRECAENFLLMGRTGAGKSTLIRFLLAHFLPTAALLYVAPKAGDAQDIVRIARACGKPVTIIDGKPGSPGLNVFAALKGVPLEDTGLYCERVWEAVSAAVNRDSRRQAGGPNAYFVQSARQLVRFIGDLLALAGEPITPDAILRVCRWVPKSAADLTCDKWRAGYLFQTLKKAFARAPALGLTAMYGTVSEYFTIELANLADNTKTCVLQEVSSLGDLLTRGACRRALFEGTLDPTECIDRGESVVIDVPFVQGDVGKAVGAGAFYAFQQAALKRTVGPETPLYFLCVDEAQELWNFDAHAAFAAVCRSQRTPLLLATQCINSLIEKAGGGSGARERVEVLIGNCNNRFFANPTPATAKWVVESLIGRTRQLYTSASVGGAAEGYDSPLSFACPGPSRTTAGASEQLQLAVEPQELFALATGGAAFDYRIEALWFKGGDRQGGRAFSILTVDQRKLL